MNLDPSVIATFAPAGKLRASINLGNPILVNQHADTGELFGVSIDLARAFAAMLGVEVEWIVFDTAGKSVEAVGDERADFGFFAVDPARGEKIAFTAPYVLIEGFYLVREDSPVRTNADVDQPHNRVIVGQRSAYDLFLTRELKHARIVRAPSSQAVVQTFLEQDLEVAAGVKQQLEADIRTISGVRLLDERFMVIRQAMGVSKRRGTAAAAVLNEFVKNRLASGFVADALKRHAIAGASVAPGA